MDKLGGLHPIVAQSGPVPAEPRTLSGELHALALRAPEQAFSLGQLLEILGARSSGLLILVCALPFCSPITLPGLSMPFGLVVALLASRFAAGLPPWLPQRLRRVELQPKTLTRILEAGSKVLGWIEKRVRVRWEWVVDANWKLRLHSIVVVLSAILLMMPFPPVPPLTNTLPALVVVVLTVSMLERDGAGIVVGYALFVGMLIYFGLCAGLIAETVAKLWQWFGF